MKAVVRTNYGGPRSLELVEMSIPTPDSNELLIRIKATTVNRTGCAILTGNPWIMRLFTGLTKPKRRTTGTDFAGIVEAMGSAVKGFRLGDRVWGFNDNGLSTHAEYACIGTNKTILKIPEGIDFKTAVASAEGAHYAYYFLDKVSVQPGDEILVNGGTGAIGSALIQLCRFKGANVTATCRGEHSELVRKLGAQRTIDYTATDFTKDSSTFDFVFDSVGKSTFFKCKSLLKKKGIYISSELGPNMQNVWLSLLCPLFPGKTVKFPVPLSPKRSLAFIQERLIDGSFRPLIDNSYSLEEVPQAFEYVMSEQKVGNVLIEIE